MKKLSWSKHLLLAGSIMVVAFACQCQKKADTEQAQPSQDDNGEDEDTCSAPRSLNDTEPAVKAEEPVPAAPMAEPVTEKVVSVPATPTAVATPEVSEVIAPASQTLTETQSGMSVAEPSNLESVHAVSENRVSSTPSSNDSNAAPVQN